MSVEDQLQEMAERIAELEARVQRVREALDKTVAECPRWGIAHTAGVHDCAKVIRAALDGEPADE